MSKAWPIVNLDEVLRLDLDRVPVNAETCYPMVGVLSFGHGLFEREAIENGKTTYRVFYRLKADHIVMSQLFGWEGALALCTDKFAGRYLSPQFPTFVADQTKLDRRFFGWTIRRPTFWEELGKRAVGMGDRRRTLNPEALLALEIPLPPLSEQRRIVARIEELAAQIQEAQTAREQAAKEVEALVISLHLELSGERVTKLGQILTLDEDAVPIVADGSYPQVGVKSFGGGLFPKTATAGTDTTYRIFNRLYSGAVVLSQVKGWEGALDVCPDRLARWFVSPEYRTFRCIDGAARPGYLAPIVRSKWFWGKLTDATRGVGARRERTRPEQFLKVEIPMPDYHKQLLGERAFEQVDALKRLQAETAAELDALLPSILDKAFKGEL